MKTSACEESVHNRASFRLLKLFRTRNSPQVIESLGSFWQCISGHEICGSSPLPHMLMMGSTRKFHLKTRSLLAWTMSSELRLIDDVYEKQDDGEQGACVGARKLFRLICPSMMSMMLISMMLTSMMSMTSRMTASKEHVLVQESYLG